MNIQEIIKKMYPCSVEELSKACNTSTQNVVTNLRRMIVRKEVVYDKRFPYGRYRLKSREDEIKYLSYINKKKFLNLYGEISIRKISEILGINWSDAFVMADYLVSEGIVEAYNKNVNCFRIKKLYGDYDYYGINIEQLMAWYNNRISLTLIAEILKVPYSRVYMCVQRLISEGKLKKRLRMFAQQAGKYKNEGYYGPCKYKIDYAQFKKDNKRMSINQLALKYGISHASISKIREYMKNPKIIDTKRCEQYNSINKQMLKVSEKDYIRLYPDMTIKQLMKYFNVSEATVRAVRNKLVQQGKLEPKNPRNTLK